MVTVDTTKQTQEAWHALVARFHDVSLMQLWEYGRVKEELQGWKIVHHVFHDGGRVVGVAQGVVKRLPLLRGGMLWMNRGPLWRGKDAPADVRTLEQLIAAVRTHWSARGYYVRIAPPITADGDMPARFRALGMAVRSQTAWTSAIVDCTRGDAALRAALQKKWRNCLARAERLGCTYVSGTDNALFEQFERDYRAFRAEKSYTTPITPEFIRALNDALPAERKLRVHSATCQGQHCGSILTAEYHGTAEYLVGAVSAAGKRANAGQFLLWHALTTARERGVTHFDLGGMHPALTPQGIYHFKAGLGGAPYALLGDVESARGIVPRLTRRVVALIA